MGYRQIRQMPPGMAGDKSDSTRDSNHGVFLGNKRLRSKSGLEGGTEWRLKHPATRYKKNDITESSVMFLIIFHVVDNSNSLYYFHGY